MNESSSPVDILLVEDNAGDVEMVREALSEWSIPNVLSVASDGVEAMRFLRRESPFSAVPRPDLILLDLNLPKKNGREVLQEVKSDGRLKMIPIVVLTSSTSDEDVLTSYTFHANAYIHKPLSFFDLLDAIKAVESFWFTYVKLPPKVRF